MKPKETGNKSFGLFFVPNLNLLQKEKSSDIDIMTKIFP